MSDPADVKGILDAYEKARASFRSRYLHALEPLIRASCLDILRWSTSGLMVEPVTSGGAVLVTTDGRSLAAIFDAKARATRPMRLTVPDDLFKGVEPPDGVRFVDQGDTFTMPLPEWATPAEVYAWGLAAYVLPAMPHPHFDAKDDCILTAVRAEDGNSYEGGYRIHKEPPTLDWRRIFKAERAAPSSRINLYPDVLARFGRIERMFGVGIEYSIAGPEQPIILTVPGHPEFVGAMMPNNTPIEARDLPGWVRPAEDVASEPRP